MAEVAMPVVVAALKGEDLGKKCNQRIKPIEKGERRESWTNRGFQTPQ
jgi:hypothetical protein